MTRIDYDQAARDLFSKFGLDDVGRAGGSAGGMRGLYNPLDQIWGDRQTGGKIFVGNQQAAQNAALLKQHGITHVINCTDNMPFFHANTFTYLRFNVTFWSRGGEAAEAIHSFLKPMFEFVEQCLASGGSVLVHCLAGAHRAGTTGIMLLMYKAGLSAAAAVGAAKQLRPVIDPIGRFPELLRKFESLQHSPTLRLAPPAALAQQAASNNGAAAGAAASTAK